MTKIATYASLQKYHLSCIDVGTCDDAVSTNHLSAVLLIKIATHWQYTKQLRFICGFRSNNNQFAKCTLCYVLCTYECAVCVSVYICV